MAPWTQFFEIDGRHYGQSTRDWEVVKAEEVPPESLAWYCPHCGVVWARAGIVSRPWYFYRQSCERCGQAEGGLIPGSLWDPMNEQFNEALPEPVVRRELRLHLAHFRGVRL